jgi:hypothetical protein
MVAHSGGARLGRYTDGLSLITSIDRIGAASTEQNGILSKILRMWTHYEVSARRSPSPSRTEILIRCDNLRWMTPVPPTLTAVLESAARLQEVVPDAVLVGESAAAWHAGHRASFDHDHVLHALTDRMLRPIGPTP